MESEADRTDVSTFNSWYVCATDYKGWFTLLALRLVFTPTPPMWFAIIPLGTERSHPSGIPSTILTRSWPGNGSGRTIRGRAAAAASSNNPIRRQLFSIRSS